MPRVLVVDDSRPPGGCSYASSSRDGDVAVAGEAADGAEAVRMTARLAPDLVTMDVQMPVMDGFKATRRIMRETPTPILMISAVQPDEVAWSFKAIEAGALAVLAEPPGPLSPQFETQADTLVRAVKELAQVKVVTRRLPRTLRSQAARPAGRPRAEVKVVAIGASTGGPAALAKVVSSLPARFAVPVLVVQHIGGGLDRGLVEWLDGVGRVPSRSRPRERRSSRGRSRVPHDRHLGVSRAGRILLSDAPPIGGHRPSATHLFHSVASAFGPGAIGVIMTGIGTDGCDGIRVLRQMGGTVLAQDRGVVRRLRDARAVVDAGLADHVVSLDSLAEVITSLVADGSSVPRASGDR